MHANTALAAEPAAPPMIVAPERIPGALWLISGVLAALALVGAGLWANWLIGAPAELFADPTWRFICH